MKFLITYKTDSYFIIWPEAGDDLTQVNAFFACRKWLVANFGKEGVTNGWIAEPMLGFRIYKANLEKLVKFQLTWM